MLKVDDFLQERPKSEFHRVLQFCVSTRREVTHYRSPSSVRASLSLWKVAYEDKLVPDDVGGFLDPAPWYQLLASENVVGSVLKTAFSVPMGNTAVCSNEICPRFQVYSFLVS